MNRYNQHPQRYWWQRVQQPRWVRVKHRSRVRRYYKQKCDVKLIAQYGEDYENISTFNSDRSIKTVSDNSKQRSCKKTTQNMKRERQYQSFVSFCENNFQRNPNILKSFL